MYIYKQDGREKLSPPQFARVNELFKTLQGLNYDDQERELLRIAENKKVFAYADRLRQNIKNREEYRKTGKGDHVHKKSRANESCFVFRKLPSHGSQQLIFNFLDLQTLIKIRALNYGFFKLLITGAVPSSIYLDSNFNR